MKKENQVCSLELAKKLKELKVKQESLWWWQKQKSWFVHQYKPDREEVYSAFTVAELGEMLTKRNVKKFRKMIMAIPNEDCIFNPDYWASILIYLLENKLLKV